LFTGWHAVSSLVEHVRRFVEAGERLVYAYYPSIDSVAHAHGLHDGFYEKELAGADRLVGDLLAVLPETAALMITSDHGQVHVGPDGWLGLDRLDGLVDAYSGDGRFRYLHARRGAAADLADSAREQHGEHAWVFTREMLLDEGWLGSPVGPAAKKRVGDVVLAARGRWAFVDPTLPREAKLVSAHGSITEPEMLVPLLAGRGRA
jgi:predicted AlkP superfamily pyrophosphatase or phosphodiesterase